MLNFGFGGKITPLTSFVVGLVASVSSCLAIVGGLVLSLSAKVAKDDNGSTQKPFVLFHVGRLFGFALLGGVLGMIGQTLGSSLITSSILGLLVSVTMLLLGFNLFGIFKKNIFTLPDGLFSFFRKVEHTTWAPILIGIGTFFLPCGFTQSMQVAAFGSGSFISGLLIMFLFALRTLPILALLSFSSVSLAHSKHAPLFFKSAGVVVIAFALFGIMNSFTTLGITLPSSSSSAQSGNVSIIDGKQIIDLTAKDGYSPARSVAKAGMPTILRFTTNGTFDCSSSVRIPSMSLFKSLSLSGQTDIDLGSPKIGILQGSCGMGMYPFQVDFQS